MNPTYIFFYLIYNSFKEQNNSKMEITPSMVKISKICINHLEDIQVLGKEEEEKQVYVFIFISQPNPMIFSLQQQKRNKIVMDTKYIALVLYFYEFSFWKKPHIVQC